MHLRRALQCSLHHHTFFRRTTTTKHPRSLILSNNFSQDAQESDSLQDTMAISLKPDFGEENTLFPPLPTIESQATRVQVFTHRSVFGRPTHSFEDHPNDPSPDNEKFEHLGDVVLGLTVTRLLMEMFPGLRVGPSTKIRAMVVANPTLAEISLKYNLPEKLRLHPAQAITLRASTNVQADIFEAFVGGLYVDQGDGTVRSWLNKLFRPYAISAYQIARRQHGLPPLPLPHIANSLNGNGNGTSTKDLVSLISRLNLDVSPDTLVSEYGNGNPTYVGRNISITEPTIGHLPLFNQLLQKANRSVEWVYDDLNVGEALKGDQPDSAAYRDMCLPAEDMIKGTKVTPVWYVKVLVDGELYGKGRGSTKKAARNEAAKEGLEKLGIKVW